VLHSFSCCLRSPSFCVKVNGAPSTVSISSLHRLAFSTPCCLQGSRIGRKLCALSIRQCSAVFGSRALGTDPGECTILALDPIDSFLLFLDCLQLQRRSEIPGGVCGGRHAAVTRRGGSSSLGPRYALPTTVRRVYEVRENVNSLHIHGS
jgi:hypothetical protein